MMEESEVDDSIRNLSVVGNNPVRKTLGFVRSYRRKFPKVGRTDKKRVEKSKVWEDCESSEEDGGTPPLRQFLVDHLFQKKEIYPTNLCKLIGYQGKENEGVHALLQQLKSIWNCRGRGLQKELCPVLSVFGIQGQGKTELCHQIATTAEIVLPDVDYFVKLHVTFHQTTSYPVNDEGGANCSILDSLLWRIFSTLDATFEYPRSWKVHKGITMQDLLREIRTVIGETMNIEAKKIGVLIMIDELLKVKDEEKIGILLNSCASLQQAQLSESYPTFFLFTSLKYVPIKQKLCTESGRPVNLIPLTVMSDQSLSELAGNITIQLNYISSIGDDRLLKRLNNCCLIQHYVNVTVWTAGSHFRSLECMLDCLYHIIVPEDRHMQVLKTHEDDGMCNIARAFNRSIASFSVASEVDLYKRLDSAKAREDVMKMLFSHCSQSAMSSASLDQLFDKTIHCFNMLLVDRESHVNEQDFFDLEAEGVLFVKWRNCKNFSDIIPRISLPFIYSYATQKISRNNLSNSDCTVDPLPLLLGNMARSLNGVDETLPLAFEKAMFNAELLHYYARCKVYPNLVHVCVHDILRHTVMNGWKGCGNNLVFRKRLLHNPLRLVVDLPDSADCAEVNANRMIDNSRHSNDVVIFGQNTSAITKLIEYVACHVSVLENTGQERDVLLLCSMKLRQANSITFETAKNLAVSIHTLAKAANLTSGSYYVVLYCCTPRDMFLPDGLPEGTIIVPIEDVQALLHPFGASFLLGEAVMHALA